MIRLVKVQKITDKPEVPPGFIPVNTLSWFPNNTLNVNGNTINVYEVTPYHLKDSNGNLFENIWQSVKCYRKVYPQKQVYNNVITWEYPEEMHVNDNEDILPAYWNWRQRVMTNPHPIRYPNGFKGRHECLCALWPDENGIYHPYNYLNGRKEIYCKLYRDLVKTTSAWRDLKALVDSGQNLQFIDIDVPPEHPTIVTEQTFKQYLSDPSIPFGHTWTLAATLLGHEEWLD